VKLSLRTSRAFSLKSLGLLLSGGGAVLIICSALPWGGPGGAIAGVALLIAGAVMSTRQEQFAVLRSRRRVLARLKETLEQMHLPYEEDNDRITVRRTTTALYTTGIATFTLLTIHRRDPSSKRERYLTDTLVKYQS